MKTKKALLCLGAAATLFFMGVKVKIITASRQPIAPAL